MLDYKDIITKHYVLHMSGREIARTIGVSKTGVNTFLSKFEKCELLSFPLPKEISNYGIYELVYGKAPGSIGRNEDFSLPDFDAVHKQMTTRKNMTLVYQWNRYRNACAVSQAKSYSYRQFCKRYARWCDDNEVDAHFAAVIAQTMEVDFAGQTFQLVSRLTGEISDIVVFVAVLPYSQYIYAEGMTSTKEPQWIAVNNNALDYFGGVPSIVVCDNCKQAVLVNEDWIQPDLNPDYEDWAEHNGTAIIPAKVKRPKYKSSVEDSVGILEKGFFHDLEENTYFSLDQFNEDLWEKLYELNHAPFKKKEHDRAYYWEEEKEKLIPLPSTKYQYMERKKATVSSDFHVRFDNAYYSVDKAYKHKRVSIKATTTVVKIYSESGTFICEHPRATYKGQWVTDRSHLPESFHGYGDWSTDYFTSKAMTVGPNTVEVIRQILKSRKYEVQTYRLCVGVLNFRKKYGDKTLEECCRQAIEADRVNYSYIKNTILSVAETSGSAKVKAELDNERNSGAYIMDHSAVELDALLAKSRELASGADNGSEVKD